MKKVTLIVITTLLLLAACKQQVKHTPVSDKLIFRFTIDSNGTIVENDVREQVLALGKELEKSANKMMLNSYTEQSGSEEQNIKTAKEMAKAVRELMKTQGGRNATNVGVEIIGYKNPIDSINAANRINRRIEIVPLF